MYSDKSETSIEMGMGVTPADFNEQNGRMSPEFSANENYNKLDLDKLETVDAGIDLENQNVDTSAIDQRDML